MSPDHAVIEPVDAYARAGVDIDRGNEVVRRIGPHAARTARPETSGTLGGFGAAFAFDPSRWREPVLVSGTDGVGTKLKVAAEAERWRSVGIDLVAMCVNDIATVGAEPLFFLDYLATSRLDPDVIEDVVAGVADGCLEAGCALVGGETAELPGMYQPGDLDIAGFVVGCVERAEQWGPDRVREGDALIGVASSGLHSNGYSLVRHVLLEREGLALDAAVPELGRPLVDELLQPTRIYVDLLRSLRTVVQISAVSHITGGGLLENVPRVLPPGLEAVIQQGSWDTPPIFKVLRTLGNLTPTECLRTFNMGIGLVVVLAQEACEDALAHLAAHGERAWQIGTVCSGDGGVRFEGQLEGAMQ